VKKISTTTLAKQLGLNTREAFQVLMDKKYVEREGQNWILTKDGQDNGGEFRESVKYGRYIVWPSEWGTNENFNKNAKDQTDYFLTSTAIGKHFELSPNKINFILSELGWVKKGELKGWVLTQQGKKMGGVQAEVKQTGVPFVRWHQSIAQVAPLVDTIAQVKGTASKERKLEKGTSEEKGFREKFEAKLRTTDGHFVRSKAEMLIDNWLYMAEIVHAYERKLPIEEDVYCDFYIPTGKVYIEYWGYENDQKYLARKKTKQEIYQKYGFNLIEVEDKDVQNLDDILPRFLLKFGVQAY
tara:strand:- start:966 stop:1859 length:894 start_codon:yes stop_codon:yes gene_type:complete